MPFKKQIFIIILFSISLFSNTILDNKNIENIIKEELNNRDNLLLISKNKLSKYYIKNNYELFWFNKSGVKKIAFELLKNIKEDPVLKPKIDKLFKLDKIVSVLDSLDNKYDKYSKNSIKLDFIFTQLYDKYMRYLTYGSIDWKKFQTKIERLQEYEIEANWKKYNPKINFISKLQKAVKKDDILFALNRVDFNFPNSKELQKALLKLEKIQENGGFVKIKNNQLLKEGITSETVKTLRQRLLQSGDLISNCSNTIVAKNSINNDPISSLNKSDVVAFNNDTKNEETNCEYYFDKNLKKALISFQKRNGLLSDGVAGKNTIKHLNTPIENKIEIIRLNLERMRWLPRYLGSKYLIVNIPSFSLDMYNNKKVELSMPVIVGDKKHPTPIFSDKISYIVLNPYWKIPKSIVKKQIIPKVIENPEYLINQGIQVHTSWDVDSEYIDSLLVDWTKYGVKVVDEYGNQSPYLEDNLEDLKFIQAPGNKNPLGRIKFMFPNKYSVYLHDTPTKYLFKRNSRAFSHGCIRVSKPKELLKKISKIDSNIDYQQADMIFQDEQKDSLGLKNKIPVHIIYLTSWVDENGKLNFRNDIYGYDSMQKKLLFK